MSYTFKKLTFGGGGGSGIIDVTELPTENIEQDKIYRVTKQNPSEVYWYVRANGTTSTAEEMCDVLMGAGEYLKGIYHVFDELPENTPENMDILNEFGTADWVNKTVNVAVLKETGEMFIYKNGSGWDSMSARTASFGFGEFKGLISSIDEITEDGQYTIIGEPTTEVSYGIPDATKKICVFEKATEVKTFAVDDSFPRYTLSVGNLSAVFAKVSDIVFDDITDYLKDEYTFDYSSVGMGVLPLSALQYSEQYKCYASDVCFISNDDSVLGFGTTGVFVMVESNGMSADVTVTAPILVSGWKEIDRD